MYIQIDDPSFLPISSSLPPRQDSLRTARRLIRVARIRGTIAFASIDPL